MKHCNILFTFIFLTGCSSTFKVVSDPIEADVLVGTKKSELKLVGKTPLDLTTNELIEKIGENENDFFIIEVKKEGFETEHFSFPKLQSGVLLSELNVKLKKDEGKESQLKTAQDIVNQLFLAQKFALSGQFERAMIQLDKILEEYPDFSRAASMKGSIHLAQKNYQESLKWYEKAIELDPKMEETVKLAAKVRELIGGRQPAGSRQ
jgi:tetratricopeptide (TPR) repeat protein